MATKNNRNENGNDVFENVDPLQPKLENVDPEFNFPVMLSEFESRTGDDDKKRAAILSRVKVNEGHIRRINNLIDQLKFKLVAESGGVWISNVVKPITQQLTAIFDQADVELVPMTQNTAAVIIISRKNISPAQKARGEGTKSVTLVPAENGVDVCVRNYEEYTSEYPKNSLGDLQGKNHPSISLDRNNIIQEIINWLR